MFDIGAAELLVIVVTAIVVIGPKEMPRALRTAGRWIGKMRRMSNHFRTGLDAMIREAEMEEAEKEWRERNRQIMARSGGPQFGSDPVEPAMEPLPAPQDQAANEADARAEAAIERAKPKADKDAAGEPELPLDPPAPPEQSDTSR
ncbi:MAG: Sec-independent protein translocase protein TatB [Erythrobacter sp.]|nr:Sec-independent protein translocase protein TatB [Erythrobacter sp.]